jgi:hypothetical protein
MKQLERASVTDKRSVPFNVAGTGTVVTQGIAIVGTGTLFNTEMKAGSYLVNLATNEAIKVIRKDSDTLAFLEKAFTSDFASAAPQIIAWNKAKVKKLKLTTVAANFIDGVAYTGTFEIDKLGDDRSSRPNLIEPVILDSTAGPTIVEIIYY